MIKNAELEIKENKITEEKTEKKEKKEEKEEEESKYSEILKKIPLKNKITLSSHTKTINTIKIDKYNQKLITGASDYKISFYDLQSMTKSLKPFRTLQPMNQQIITSVDFNCSGKKIITCSEGSKPKILTKDGKEQIEFIQGDMYIRDLLYTKGHTFTVTDSSFSKTEENICYTSSKDGTIRIWDLNARPFGVERQLPCKTVIKCKYKGKKAAVDRLLVTDKNKMVVGFGQDMVIQCFMERNYYNRPVLCWKGQGIAAFTDACFCVDPIKFYVRCTDDSVKLFDLRKFEQPVSVIQGLYNDYFRTGIVLARDRRYFVTGVSKKRDENGRLVVVDTESEEIVYEEDFGPNNIGAIVWNHSFNQLFIGKGKDLVSTYDEELSKGGIMTAIEKESKKTKIENMQIKQNIYVPNALPMFKPDLKFRRRRFDKIRQDEVLTKKPEVMLSGPGFNGLISGPRTTIQNLMRTIHEIKGKKVDVIERAKKFENSKDNPQFVENAYLFTQPKRILDYDAPIGEQQKLMSLFKKCKHCGLKICQCIDYTKK